MKSITEKDQRAEYISGLYALGDLLRDQPTLVLPYSGATPRRGEVDVFTDTNAEFTLWAAALTGTGPEEEVPGVHYRRRLRGSLRGLHVLIYGPASDGAGFDSSPAPAPSPSVSTPTGGTPPGPAAADAPAPTTSGVSSVPVVTSPAALSAPTPPASDGVPPRASLMEFAASQAAAFDAHWLSIVDALGQDER